MSILVLFSAAPVNGFDELTRVMADLSPSHITQGSSTHFLITVHNENDQALVLSSLTLQISKEQMWNTLSEYELYEVDVGDGVVPSNGSRTFEHTGIAPDYQWQCPTMVLMAGSLGGSENTSLSAQTLSIFIDPSNTMSFTWIIPLIVLVPLAIIIVAVLLLYLMNKPHPVPGNPTCPFCGTPITPRSTFCQQCGRKL